jgi:hypothetical protein
MTKPERIFRSGFFVLQADVFRFSDARCRRCQFAPKVVALLSSRHTFLNENEYPMVFSW